MAKCIPNDEVDASYSPHLPDIFTKSKVLLTSALLNGDYVHLPGMYALSREPYRATTLKIGKPTQR